MTNDLAKGQQNVTDIFYKYRVQLKNYIAKRVFSKEDREDILQNVFYQLSKIDMIEKPIEQMSAWLYSVANNQIIDRSRKHREVDMPYVTAKDDEDTFFAEVSSLMFDKDASPETTYLRTLVWEELDAALSELPIEQREAFELTELDGFSFKEISEATGCFSSSSIWNSQPIAEPSPLFKSGFTKYFIPLFAPSVILKSTFSIKFLYLRIVTISPPFVDSPPPLFSTFKIPLSITQPLDGKVLIRAPFHPSVVLPSHNNFHPSLVSCSVNTLS